MMRLLAALLASLFFAPPSLAQKAADERTEELAKIERRLKDREAEEKQLKTDALAKEKEIAALRFRMIETANALHDSERKLGQVGQEIERLTNEETGLAARLKAQQSDLGDVLAALQSIELSRPPALLISPKDANRAASAAILLSDAAPQLEAKARALRNDLTRLKAVRAERDRERAAFLKTKDEVRARRTVLGELLKKKQAERDMAAALAAAAQRETAALASRATSLREVIERLERLARTISPRLKPPAPKIRPPGADPEIARGPLTADSKSERFRPTTAFAQARGALKPPVVGRVIGAFGSRTATGGRLDGLRFAAPDAALVTAPFEAKVAFARAWNPVGNLVVLDVGGGYHMLLLGVNVFLVQEGETVAAGQPIATMAAKAGAREANLDLEIRKNGEPVNPSLWLSRKSVDEMGF